MEYNGDNIRYAKEMRSNMTKEESTMWYHLRAKRFLGLKFKRQVPLGAYIVDFLCKEKNLVIELDGGQHNEQDSIDYDEKRSEYLKSQGYTVLRFWNNDVNNNIDAVLETIRQIVS